MFLIKIINPFLLLYFYCILHLCVASSYSIVELICVGNLFWMAKIEGKIRGIIAAKIRNKRNHAAGAAIGVYFRAIPSSRALKSLGLILP